MDKVGKNDPTKEALECLGGVNSDRVTGKGKDAGRKQRGNLGGSFLGCAGAAGEWGGVKHENPCSRRRTQENQEREVRALEGPLDPRQVRKKKTHWTREEKNLPTKGEIPFTCNKWTMREQEANRRRIV